MPQCNGKYKNGLPCRYKAKNNGFCGLHSAQYIEDCSVCFEDIKSCENIKLNCGHIYHKKCIGEWMKLNSSCPMCRAEITEEVYIKMGILQPMSLEDLAYLNDQIMNLLALVRLRL